jgi:hypothetical protein
MVNGDVGRVGAKIRIKTPLAVDFDRLNPEISVRPDKSGYSINTCLQARNSNTLLALRL